MDEYIKKTDILAEIETAVETGRLNPVSGSQLYRWVLQLEGLKVDTTLKTQDEFDTLADYVAYLQNQATNWRVLAGARLQKLQDCRDTLERIKDLCDREIIG